MKNHNNALNIYGIYLEAWFDVGRFTREEVTTRKKELKKILNEGNIVGAKEILSGIYVMVLNIPS